MNIVLKREMEIAKFANPIFFMLVVRIFANYTRFCTVFA